MHGLPTAARLGSWLGLESDRSYLGLHIPVALGYVGTVAGNRSLSTPLQHILYTPIRLVGGNDDTHKSKQSVLPRPRPRSANLTEADVLPMTMV